MPRVLYLRQYWLVPWGNPLMDTARTNKSNLPSNGGPWRFPLGLDGWSPCTKFSPTMKISEIDSFRLPRDVPPNALIPKTKGRGTVPHFNGRVQEEILEGAPATAVEIYACVTCLYSAAAMDETEGIGAE